MSRIEPFSRQIQTWAHENREKLLEAFDQKGGWEGWAQVELAFYLPRKFLSSGQVVVTREEAVYADSNDRVDIMAKSSLGGTYLIELKTQSVYNFKGFIPAVQVDQKKLAAAHAVKDAFWVKGQATLYSIVLSVDENGHDAMKKMEDEHHYGYQLHPKLQDDDPVKVWWLKKELHRS